MCLFQVRPLFNILIYTYIILKWIPPYIEYALRTTPPPHTPKERKGHWMMWKKVLKSVRPFPIMILKGSSQWDANAFYSIPFWVWETVRTDFWSPLIGYNVSDVCDMPIFSFMLKNAFDLYSKLFLWVNCSVNTILPSVDWWLKPLLTKFQCAILFICWSIKNLFFFLSQRSCFSSHWALHTNFGWQVVGDSKTIISSDYLIIILTEMASSEVFFILASNQI